MSSDGRMSTFRSSLMPGMGRSTLRASLSPNFVLLQRIEQNLDEFGLFTYYLTFIMIVKIVTICVDIPVTFDTKLRTAEQILHVIQVIGYANGLQALSSKSLRQGLKLQAFIAFAIFTNFYYVYATIRDPNIPKLLFNLLSIGFNIFLFIVTRRFVKLLIQKKELQILLADNPASPSMESSTEFEKDPKMHSRFDPTRSTVTIIV